MRSIFVCSKDIFCVKLKYVVKTRTKQVEHFYVKSIEGKNREKKPLFDFRRNFFCGNKDQNAIIIFAENFLFFPSNQHVY